MLLPVPSEQSDYLRSTVSRQLAPRGFAMTKIVKILVLVAILTVTLAISPAQACACGPPDWSMMSDREIVSTITGSRMNLG